MLKAIGTKRSEVPISNKTSRYAGHLSLKRSVLTNKCLVSNNQGFIAIVALGIFLLLSVFGIIIQDLTTNTINRVKDTNQYYEARDIADSVMEYVRWELNNKEAGYNYKPSTCLYGDFAAVAGEADPCADLNAQGVLNSAQLAELGYDNIQAVNIGITSCSIIGQSEDKVFKFIDQGNGCYLGCTEADSAGGAGAAPDAAGNVQNEPICDQILSEVGIWDGDVANKDVKITVEITGRNEESEKFTGNCSNTFSQNGCYTVPLPGTGNAGERCELYKPDFSGNGSAIKPIDDKGQIIAQLIAGEVSIKQIDYSCNWNRLTFGSSVTDRAVIPLYYQDGNDIINPYFNDPATPQNEADATKFVLRIRTPCEPQDNANGGNSSEDDTICTDNDRYVLDEEENDIVVQWQISGTCVDAQGNEEQCGLIQNVNLNNPADSSAITESRINDGDGWLFTKEVLYQDFQALETNTENINFIPVTQKLILMKKPTLTLFLGDKLISEGGENVPYLEYQVLTEVPVANASTIAEVIVNVDGIVFKKTLQKEEQTPLIDFAVQN